MRLAYVYLSYVPEDAQTNTLPVIIVLYFYLKRTTLECIFHLWDT